jgi:hypothetical protein
MKKTTVYLDEKLWLAFRVQCVQRQTSASQAVGRLITAWLAHVGDQDALVPVTHHPEEIPHDATPTPRASHET